MGAPHYVLRRSRSGRFNFTLLSDHGRVTGVVMVQTENASRAEVERRAHEKIQALAESLRSVVGRPEGA